MVMPKNNINHRANFDTKRDDQYEDYNLTNLITL